MQQMNEAAGGDLQPNLVRSRPATLAISVCNSTTKARPNCTAAAPSASEGGAAPARAGGTASSGRPRCRGTHPGEFFLILRGDAGHFDGAAAVGTRRRRRRPVGLVDLRRATSGTLPAVLRPGPSAGPLTCPLRPVLGKGCSLPFAGAAGLIEFRSLRRFQRSRSRVVRSRSRVVRSRSRVVRSRGPGWCGPGPGWCGPNRHQLGVPR